MRLKIQDVRRSKQIKQETVAAEIGISPGYYSQIERSVRPLTTTRLGEISKALGCSPNDLIDMDAPSPDDDAEVLRLFRSLTSHQREVWHQWGQMLQNNESQA